MPTDITFPMKGWRGMTEWVRSSEEKITVSRNALSFDVPGKDNTHIHTLTQLQIL